MPPPVRATPRDVFLLIFLGILWGISFMFIKAGLRDFSPIWFAAIRYDIAALVMVAIVLPRGLRTLVPQGSLQWKAVLVAAALNVMGYHAFLFWGQEHTTAAVAAVVVSLNPITAMVVARAVLPGERVGAGGLVGLLVGILGIAVLVGLKPGALFDQRGIGELAVFGAVLSWSIGSVYIKRTHHQMPVLQFTTLQMLLGALMLHGLSVLVEGTAPRSALTTGSVVSLLYLSIFASGLGFLVYFTLLERIGPIRSTLVSYIAPAAAALAGLLVLGEAIELRAVLAFVLIALGFRLVIATPKETPLEAPPSEGDGPGPAAAWDEREP